MDLPLTLAAALTSLALLRWVRRRNAVSLLLAGGAAGLAVAAGVAGLVVLVAVVIVVAVTARGTRWRERVWRALAASAVIVVVHWLCCGPVMWCSIPGW